MTTKSEDPGFKVNYSLRPAKCIERKMMVEALHRLNGFHELRSYQYIGFGSAWFSDFILFHKSLGIHDMINIEEDVAHEKRYRFNRPYKCIVQHFGPSNSVLPTLPLGKQAIIWLDYTGRLDKSVLEDIQYVSAKAKSGSVLMITVNADPIGDGHLRPVASMLKSEGTDYGRVHAENIDALGKWATATTYRQMIYDKILLTLRDRNGVLNPNERISYQQIFNFNYRDSESRMLTTGGLYYENRQSDLVEKCNFRSSFDFFKPEKESYLIDVPILTLREIRMLEAQLPTDCEEIDRKSIPEVDVKKYEKIYRYYPLFTEAEL